MVLLLGWVIANFFLLFNNQNNKKRHSWCIIDLVVFMTEKFVTESVWKFKILGNKLKKNFFSCFFCYVNKYLIFRRLRSKRRKQEASGKEKLIQKLLFSSHFITEIKQTGQFMSQVWAEAYLYMNSITFNYKVEKSWNKSLFSYGTWQWGLFSLRCFSIHHSHDKTGHPLVAYAIDEISHFLIKNILLIERRRNFSDPLRTYQNYIVQSQW